MKTLLSYEEAQKLVQSLGIKTSKQYKYLAKNGKLPKGLPLSPEYYYGRGLNARRRGMYPDIKEASLIAQKLKLKTGAEYLKLARADKLPRELPRDPQSVYQKKWKGFNSFLKLKNISKKGYSREGIKHWSYERAQIYVQKINVKSENDYKARHKNNLLPKHLPSDPPTAYEEWKGWMIFLGKKHRVGNFLPFKEAREWARKSPIKHQREWRKKHPKNIPCHPDMYYKDWNGFNDFLNTKVGQHLATNFSWPPYEEALKLVSKQNLQTSKDYKKWVKKSGVNLPLNPDEVYGKRFK